MSNNLKLVNLTTKNKIMRSLWNFVWMIFFRPSHPLMHGWRAFVLRLFGADLGRPVYIYPSTKIWAPWNLTMGAHSTLADGVDCYCVDKINIGSYTTVSQYSYLCSASHDYQDPGIFEAPEMPLLSAPIIIGDYAWVTADVFVGPGVVLGDGVVVLARSTVLGSQADWTIVKGNPAVGFKKRLLRSPGTGGV